MRRAFYIDDQHVGVKRRMIGEKGSEGEWPDFAGFAAPPVLKRPRYRLSGDACR